MIKDSNLLQADYEAKKLINPKIGIAFSILILLQFYLVPLIEVASGKDLNRYASLMYIYAMSSYTIIVIGIMVFQVNGIKFFADHFTLWLIVLSCFLRSTYGGDLELFYQIYMFLLGAVLSIYIIANRKNIKTPSFKIIFVGLLWALGTAIAGALLRTMLKPENANLPPYLSPLIFRWLVLELSFVTIIEEAYFRGLLFGFLMMIGFKENTALFIQAILFLGTHYMEVGDPVLFFVIIPLLTLSVTLVMKKYKMLFLPIMVHTTNNVLGTILAYIF
jgi:hypothetical protein